MHLGASGMSKQGRYEPKRPTPVLNLFSVSQGLRVSSEPSGRKTAGVTENWVGGLAFSYAAPHDYRRLTAKLTSVAAWVWKGRREWRRCVARIVHRGRQCERGG